MKKGFINYLKGYGLVLLLVLILQISIGFVLGFGMPNLNNNFITFLGLVITFGSVLFISNVRDLGFWKLLGFSLLMNLLLTMIFSLILLVVIF